MYHPSVFADVPRKKGGVYVLRRLVEPYVAKKGFEPVNRVAVVGSASDTGVYTRLRQYFCEHTETAMSPNYRNAAIAVRDQITHIDCYFEPELMVDKVHRLAFEKILIEELEPMMRTPEGSSNIGSEARILSKNKQFRQAVMAVKGNPSCTIRLPNRDNIIADLLELNPELYGSIAHKKQPDLSEY